MSNDLVLDLERWERSSTATEEFGEIVAFIHQRPDFLREKLAQFRDDPDLPEEPR